MTNTKSDYKSNSMKVMLLASVSCAFITWVVIKCDRKKKHMLFTGTVLLTQNKTLISNQSGNTKYFRLY